MSKSIAASASLSLALLLGARGASATCNPGGQPCPPPGAPRTNFPKTVNGPGGSNLGATHGKPTIADLGLNPGHKSIIFGNAGGQLWVVNSDGTIPNGMPLVLPADVYSTPAAGNLFGHNDGLLDIVVGYGSTLDTSHPGGFRAYKNNGPSANPVFTQVWDRPGGNSSPGYTGHDPFMSSPAIGDVDGDGVPEVAIGGLDYKIYLVDGSTGLDKPGWPFLNTDTVFSSPALFDLLGDGHLDIIIGADYSIGTGGRMHAFHPDGTELPGFPIAMDQAMSSSPAVGDIDGDGRPEIVVGTSNYFSGRQHKLYAFHCDGSAVTGWPVSVAGQVVNAVALADLDGDGTPEVIVTDDNSGPTPFNTFHVYAFRGTGAPFWTTISGQPPGGRQPKDFFGQTLNASDPVVADILSGGAHASGPEILVPTNGEICVFGSDGTQLTDNGSHPPGGFSFSVNGAVGGVAVDDLDSSGTVDVIAIAPTPFSPPPPMYANSLVYDWQPQPTGVIPWGQFHHDAMHTGVLPGTPTCAPRVPVSTSFFPLTPCRVLDTRGATGPLGAPSLVAGARRTFNVGGVCGIPETAVAISTNVTVTNTRAAGQLTLFPSDVTLPVTSSISYHANMTRANNSIVYLAGTAPTFAVFTNSTGSTDFILDVNGYFQ